MTIDEKVLEAFYEIISESNQEVYDRIAAQRTNHISVSAANQVKTAIDQWHSVV